MVQVGSKGPTIEEFDAVKADVRQAYAERSAPFFSSKGFQTLPFQAITWTQMKIDDLPLELGRKGSPLRAIIISSCAPDQVDRVERIVAIHNSLRDDGFKKKLKVLLGWATARDSYIDRHTSLHSAVNRGDKQVELLLDRKVDPCVVDSFGETSLHRAATTNQHTVVKMLIDSRARVDARNMLGWTPLHKAADPGSQAVLEVLLKAGADANALCDEPPRQTPLHRAACQGHAAAVQRLLEGRADPDLLDGRQRTALDFALASETEGHKQTVKLLRAVNVANAWAASEKKVSKPSTPISARFSPALSARLTATPDSRMSGASPQSMRCMSCRKVIDAVDDDWNAAGLCDECMDNI